MKFISTRKNSPAVSASEAILQGLAVDGGLYIPESFVKLDMSKAPDYRDLPALARFILAPFFEGDELEDDLAQMCNEAFTFPAPLHYHNSRESVLELFWGPTAAFKDFGARFLAVVLEHLLKKRHSELTILVATSGDTGGAVASAFHKREGISVKVLFPEGRVSARQQKQLTVLQDNITSYAVKGTFDDCQKMVKDAFMDSGVAQTYHLSSANSINLGRLLPQMVYAFSSSMEVYSKTGIKPVAIIPSGNVGNSCASFWAKTIGAPIHSISLALNRNRTIIDYLVTKKYEKRPSLATLANAMDVGDPSNMERLFALYPTHERFAMHIGAMSVSDEQIRETIRNVYEESGYAICPHTATGEYMRRNGEFDRPTIVYSTAHPAKFETIVEPVIGEKVAIPPQLKELLDKKEHYTTIEADYHLLFS